MTQPINVVMPVYDGVTQLELHPVRTSSSRARPTSMLRVASLGGHRSRPDHLTFSDLDDLTAVIMRRASGFGAALRRCHQNELFIRRSPVGATRALS